MVVPRVVPGLVQPSSGRPLRALLAALAAAPAARGWVLFPAETLQQNDVELKSITDLLTRGNVDGRPVLYRWSASADIREDRGLGGGITYAFDPELCERMLPLFSEGKDIIRFYEFVTCATIKDVVVSGLRTWSANSRNINFLDVTTLCDNETLWTKTSGTACTSLTCNHCPLAEVVITAFESKPGDHTGARVQPQVVASRPLGTNLRSSEGGSFDFVNLEFGTNLCWYVDPSFCAFFHGLEQDGLPVVAIVGMVLGIAFLCALTLTLYSLWRLLKTFVYTMLASWDTDQDGIVEMWEVLGGGRALVAGLRNALKYGTFEGATGGRKVELDDALFAVCDVFANQMPVHYVGLMLFCLIFPVLVLNDIFLPCWQCYDFEAAAVHEIGHILGFDHPDQFPQYNFVTDRTAYNCSAPWTGVSRDSAVDANSVMQAFLARNPKTCLTRDDLDGLNFLYPVCSDTMQQEPSCEKADRNIGFPRLLQAIVSAELIPLLVLLVLKFGSRLVLATREEFVERQLRSDNLKATRANKQKEALLETRRQRRTEEKSNSRPVTAFARASRSRTAPLNRAVAEGGNAAPHVPHEPNVLTLDGSRDGERGDDDVPALAGRGDADEGGDRGRSPA